MAEDRGLADYHNQVYTEIVESAGGEFGEECKAADYKENIYTKMMAERLAELGTTGDIDLCHFCHETRRRGVMKVNGYAFDEDSAELILLNTIFPGGPELETIPPRDIRKASEQAKRFLKEAVDERGFYKELEMSQKEHDMASFLYEIRSSIMKVRIIVLAFGITKTEKIPPESFKNMKISFDIWDIQRIYRLDSSQREYETIVIDLDDYGTTLPCIHTKSGNGEYDTYMSVFPGKVIQEIYNEYGSRLLELNVRSFLQTTGKVNRGIRETLKTQPGRFLAYNNGISITADSVSTVKDKSSDSLAINGITGMQIVNGAQTVASIHRAALLDEFNIDDVYLQAKITVIDKKLKEELVPNISRFSNSQNKVNEADFSSNDPYHVELQKLSLSTWSPGERDRWFYERARGQYRVAKAKEATTPAQTRNFERKNPKSQCFTKTDLAKYLNSWDQLPHIVSRGAQYNFVHFMDKLQKTRNKDWSPDRDYYQALIGKAIVFKKIDKVALEEGIGAYKANVVTYTMAYLSHRILDRISFQKIWENQSVTPGLEEAIREWCTQIHDVIVRSAGSRNVTQWCKKEECWAAVRNESFEIPDSLRKEMAAGGPLPTVGAPEEREQSRLSTTDMENIATAMRIAPEQWLKIHGWGVQTERLNKTYAGIALTLSSYASSNWIDVPSVKQARCAVVIIQLAQEAGILEDLPDAK